MKRRCLPPVFVALLVATAVATAQPAVTLTVQTDQPGARISPTMWGIFFEDINYGADGGLYPERVKNRSFEFPNPLMGWSLFELDGAEATMSIRNEDPFNAKNPHYLRLVIKSGGRGAGVENEGFHGMGIQQGESYLFSAFARAEGNLANSLVVGLTASDGGRVIAVSKIGTISDKWQKIACTLKSDETCPNAYLKLLADRPGVLELDLVSLYPKKSFKNHGLRSDMAQMLADLKPGFMRFPGGCIVEGRYLTNRYQWKTTIGPVAERKLIMNRWNDEFKHRPSPDYFQSFGLGFYEFFQLCEDIGAEPLPILNCGMACQFNSGELCPLDQLDPYIQDALDLIEFANGPVTSTWGAKRAAMGHPRPFHLKLLGVGNEQWGPQYLERYTAFAKVLKARHPEIRLISSAGPSPDDERFQFAWPKLRELHADIVDEHCYARPDWFLNNSMRYDHYDRGGPKVFMGEYAAQSDKVVSVNNRNNWECALAEAAYMTGLERNADVVVMASYAPLFGHVEGWQWRPNLIWCDNLRSFGTPSYYVQQLFSRNRGDRVLPVQLSGTLPTEKDKPRFYATAARDEKSGEIILKVVNASARPVETAIQLDGAQALRGRGTVTVLTGALADENSFEAPRKVAPVAKLFAVAASQFSHAFPAYSLTVFRLPIRP